MGFTYGNRPGARIPAMEQRHFWFIADTLKSQAMGIKEEAETVSLHYADGLLAKTETTFKLTMLNARMQAIHKTARDFRAGCKASNVQFNGDKFIEACGFPDDKPMWALVRREA